MRNRGLFAEQILTRMNLALGARIGLLTPDPARHYEWLRSRLPGSRSVAGELALACGPMELHLSPASSPHLVVELLSTSAVAGERRIKELGGIGLGAAFLIDSFGLAIQVEEAPPPEVEEPWQPAGLLPEVGLTCDSPAEAAARYARLFSSEAYPSWDGDWIVGTRGAMLRLRRGMPGVAFLMASEMSWPLISEGQAGLDFWADPFGFHWGAPPGPAPRKASTPVF